VEIEIVDSVAQPLSWSWGKILADIVATVESHRKVITAETVVVIACTTIIHTIASKRVLALDDHRS
jgi:hypothetical protein